MKLGASQSHVQSDTTVIATSVWGGAREPQSGLPDGAGSGRAAVRQLLDKVVDVPDEVFVGKLAVEQLGVDVFFFGVKGVGDVLAGREAGC